MKYCDETLRVDIGTGGCKGWLPAGYDWHGCTLEPGHRSTGRLLHHECKCGTKWTTRKK